MGSHAASSRSAPAWPSARLPRQRRCAPMPHALVVLLVVIVLTCRLADVVTAAATGAVPDATRMARLRKPGTDMLAHVTFASCNRQSHDQSFWMTRVAPTIAKQWSQRGSYDGTAEHQQQQEPQSHTDLLLWLGNAVYADVDEAGVALSTARPAARIEEEIKLLTENAHYRQFLAEVVGPHGRVAGVWDDRDLGLRGADARYAQAEAVRRAYLTRLWSGFSLAEKDATGDGTPGALFSFSGIPAPPGSPLAAHFVHSVCTLTLDVRTQRTAPPKLADAILRVNEAAALRMQRSRDAAVQAKLAELEEMRKRVMEADLLGPRQWAWLERTAATYLSASAKSPDDAAGRAHCAVTLIASPWQILLNDNKPFEGWDLYPASRSRLLLLLKKYDVARFIFLSGHAEMGELGVVRRAAKADIRLDGPGASLVNNYPLEPLTLPAAKMLPPLPSGLVELTSSGLTHTVREASVVGRLASWFFTPRVPEDKKDNGIVKRHVFLTRTTTVERHFGTLQLIGDRTAPATNHNLTKQEVLTRTRVVLSLHGVRRAGEEALLTLERALDRLPSYDVEPQDGEMTEADEAAELAMRQLDLHDTTHLPIFNTFNVPGEYPWLKRRMVERDCAEVPCVNGQPFMLLRVAANLVLAFGTLLLFLGAVVYYQRTHTDELEMDGIKLKQD